MIPYDADRVQDLVDLAAKLVAEFNSPRVRLDISMDALRDLLHREFGVSFNEDASRAVTQLIEPRQKPPEPVLSSQSRRLTLRPDP